MVDLLDLDALPPEKSGELPFIPLQDIHFAMKNELGGKTAAAFSKIMIYEQMPEDPNVKLQIQKFLSNRPDYISQLTARKLEHIS